jgi:hypothetical protein
MVKTEIMEKMGIMDYLVEMVEMVEMGYKVLEDQKARLVQ